MPYLSVPLRLFDIDWMHVRKYERIVSSVLLYDRKRQIRVDIARCKRLEETLLLMIKRRV